MAVTASLVLLFLSLSGLKKVCAVRVMLNVSLLEYEEIRCRSCSGTLTFCIQEEAAINSPCTFGRTRFSSREDTFERNGRIGISNSFDVYNPLKFEVDSINFVIQLTVNGQFGRTSMFSTLINVSEVELDREQKVTRTNSQHNICYEYVVGCAPLHSGPNCISIFNEDESMRGPVTVTASATNDPVIGDPVTASATNDPVIGGPVTASATNYSVIGGPVIASATNYSVTGNSSATAGRRNLPAGSAAGITIGVLFLVAAIVGGVIGGILLAMYRPWSANSKLNIARMRSTSKAVNNPVYEENEFRVVKGRLSAAPTITMNGTSDLRDKTLRAVKIEMDDSNPLYFSRDHGGNGHRAGKTVEESVFVDNKTLVDMLERHTPVHGSLNSLNVHENSKKTPTMEDQASINSTQGRTASVEDRGTESEKLQTPQTDEDNYYENVTTN